jgi:hypothetical protein
MYRALPLLPYHGKHLMCARGVLHQLLASGEEADLYTVSPKSGTRGAGKENLNHSLMRKEKAIIFLVQSSGWAGVLGNSHLCLCDFLTYNLYTIFNTLPLN